MKVKNRKKFIFIIIGIFIVGIIYAYIFKPISINNVYNKPNFTGIVTEVYDKAILVSVDENEDEIKSSDKMFVSLDVKLKDSMVNFAVGDKVHVFYDGSIREIYPAGINTVYAIFLINE